MAGGDNPGGGGVMLWPLFGSTNQLLGSLTLLVISVWLFKSGGKFLVTLIPMIFITIITFIATYFNILTYIEDRNYLLLSIAFVIGVSQLWILFEGIKAFRTTETDGREL